MGRMRQMSIERVDAVDEPATGARWIIAKKSGQADDATPTLEELAKAAVEALSKDAELSISDEAGEALSALAAAVELELTLEKDESEADEAEGESEGEAEGDEEAEGEESEESEESDEGEAEGEADESDEGEADEDVEKGEESDESDEDESVEKRLDTIERALELIVEKLDAEPEAAAEPTKKSRRTSKQATGQDDLGAADTRKLSKSGKDGEEQRVSYADVLFNQ